MDVIAVELTGPEVSVPFLHKIDGEVVPAKTFTFKGIPIGRESFSVNLMCGASDGSDIALHMDVRFNAKCHRQQVALNARLNGCWGQEEGLGLCCFPFALNTPFKIFITALSDKFTIEVNDQPLADFNYRILPTSRVTYAGVESSTQVALTEVDI